MNMQFLHKRLSTQTASFAALLCLPLLLISCSSHVPPEIKEPLANEIGLQTVRANIDDYVSKRVRWGGVVLAIENRKDATWLTMLAQPLNSYGRPDEADASAGRFIAIVPDFLEPVVYKVDREITFTGIVKGSETRKVGEFEYNYPVIEVDKYHLWPEVVYIEDSRPPYWVYDPWYYPYDPFYPYPYPYRYR